MDDQSEDCDELEYEVTEEGEMLAAIRDGICYYCRKPQNSCDHLIAIVDRTFGVLEPGPLSSLFTEIEQSYDDALEEFCEQLMYLTSWVDYEDDASDRPMSASGMTYYWGKLSEVQTDLRKRLL